jgi:hypothetical protein
MHLKFSYRLFLTIAGIFAVSSGNAQNLTGYWQGEFITDMSPVPRTFFLNMYLLQEGKKIEGRFSNAQMDYKDVPEVVYEISGIIGKKEATPKNLMVGKIVYNTLLEGVAEVFLQFDDIRYFKNDTMEVLYGNWLPNVLRTRRSDGVGGTFRVKRLHRYNTVPGEDPPLISKIYNEAENPPKAIDTMSLVKLMVTRSKSEQGNVLVHSRNIFLSLYDNGTTDGDTVSIFFNGKLLASHQGISGRSLLFR